MNSFQTFVLAILPEKWSESVEAESRNWIARCPSCDFERSFWERGGIRWKGAGKEKRYISCPNCGQSHWHTISRRQVHDTHDEAAQE